MCPTCNQNNYNVMGNPAISIKASRIIKKDFKVVQCNNCKTYFVEPKIDFSKDEWKYLYDNTYFPPLSSYYSQKRLDDANDRLEGIIKTASINVQKILDVGCGEGYTIIAAAKKGLNTHALDITDHRIPKAKEVTSKFINSDLFEAQLESNFFDAVYLDSVLEHVLNPLEYLIEIRRILKPGGVLYLGVPNEDSLYNDVRKLFNKITNTSVSEKIKPFQSPYHIVGFNSKSLPLILESAGYQIKELNNFAARFEFLKVKPFTKEYFKLLFLVPIYLLAIPFRKEVYFEAYVTK